jgi:anti-sigma factor RsiW
MDTRSTTTTALDNTGPIATAQRLVDSFIASEPAPLAAHLTTCPQCRAASASYVAIAEALATGAEPPAHPTGCQAYTLMSIVQRAMTAQGRPVEEIAAKVAELEAAIVAQLSGAEA